MMNAKRSILCSLSALTLGSVLLAVPSFAADKTYQVTGPVTELTDASITVQKGKEMWQIARDKNTKVTGDLKVGEKVMIMYTMSAVSIDVKGGGAKAAAAKK